MEEIVSSPTTATTTRRKHDTSATSRMKKACLSFLVSLQEGLTYVKALFVGQQAAAAELEAEKMQVEAADGAENTKKRLDKPL
ncbi:hypothetical protein K2173_007965 [Erythroxylum novogranatense]|uniref:Uncharacterized protein n=1 Tax=Erythroxylum novogranatense TaxID=1862640 RepID=A0AAV8T809_9ROSI|nr:hypothetical protein K2173_007965 [Erythroxylum novogranatense]